MTVETQPETRERSRVFITGNCEGLNELSEALGRHTGARARRQGGPGAATPEAPSPAATSRPSSTPRAARRFPADELAAIREHTQAPVILVASGEASRAARGGARRGRRRRPAAPAADRERRLRDPQGQPRGPPAQDGARPRAAAAIVTVFSPKGGTGKTVIATNLATSFAKHAGKRTLLARPRPPVRRRGDHARHRAGEDDLRPRRRPGRARLGEARGLHRRTHPSGLDVLPRRCGPEDAELVTEAKLARLLEVARESYDAIVVDTSPFFHGPMLATLDRTDELLLALRARRADAEERPARACRRSSCSRSRASGSASSSTGRTRRSGMKQSEVEDALETKVRFELPSDRAVPLAVNRGKPAVLADRERRLLAARCGEMAKARLPGGRRGRTAQDAASLGAEGVG